MPPWVMNGYLTPAGLMPQPGLFRAAQSLDQRCMPGICRRQGMSIGQFEFTELKPGRHRAADKDRKSVVSGKSVSGRVHIGGRRIIKKKIDMKQRTEVWEM